MNGMSFWTIWWLTVGLGVALITRQLIRARRRARQLTESGRSISWKALEELTAPNGRIVCVNFGMGLEYWFLPNGNEALDFETRTFADGQIIVPKRPFKELQRLCESRRIQLNVIMVKHGRPVSTREV
jgi:hypothetical protein